LWPLQQILDIINAVEISGRILKLCNHQGRCNIDHKGTFHNLKNKYVSFKTKEKTKYAILHGNCHT
jgi:hypothetical protein